MGILNITPDSFSDGGRYIEVDAALQQCRKMVAEGADIIDIGGESTRPGSDSVPLEQQLARILPIIGAIRDQFSPHLPISVDTTSSRVAEAALKAGANIINDISAGLGDERMFSIAAEYNAPIVLMHMLGTPKTMQENPFYDDVVQEVLTALHRRIDAASAAGIPATHIAIDPGIGFGKRKQDNIELLAHLRQFVETGFPVLLGTSRKRFMGKICQIDNPTELIAATAVTTALGVMAGVKLFRVHDVKENRQALDVAWEIKNIDN